MAFYLRLFFFNIILQNFHLRTSFLDLFSFCRSKKSIYLIIKEKNIIFRKKNHQITKIVINVIIVLPLNGCLTKQLVQISPLSRLSNG